MPHTNMLDARLAVLVVIDVQEKMLSAITSRPPAEIVSAIDRLVRVARILEVPVIFTEQNPKGLGPTDSRLQAALREAGGPLLKTTCSSWRDEGFRSAIQRTEREHVVLAGLETHVCIQQTALDLLRVDYVPFVPVDAVGSRRQVDMETALGRMARAGVELSTTESIIFELVERCDHPMFKDVLRVIKDAG